MQGMPRELILLGSEVTRNGKRTIQGLSNFWALSLFCSKNLCAFVYSKTLKFPNQSLHNESHPETIPETEGLSVRKKNLRGMKTRSRASALSLALIGHRGMQAECTLPKKVMYFKDNIMDGMMQNHLLI